MTYSVLLLPCIIYIIWNAVCRFQTSICERYCSVTVTTDAASSWKIRTPKHGIAHESVQYIGFVPAVAECQFRTRGLWLSRTTMSFALRIILRFLVPRFIYRYRFFFEQTATDWAVEMIFFTFFFLTTYMTLMPRGSIL